MPNAYGQILLQQIKEQRQQRLRQRAEERGLPPPPDEPAGLSSNASLVAATPNRTHLNDSSSNGLSSAYNVAFSAPGNSEQRLANECTREACSADASTAATGASAPQQPMLPSAEAISALQALLSLAPLLTRQPPQSTAPLGIPPAACVPSMVPATLLGQQPLLLQPTAVIPSSFFPSNSQQVMQQTQQSDGMQQLAAPVQAVEHFSDQLSHPTWKSSARGSNGGAEGAEHSSNSLAFAPYDPITFNADRQRQLDAKKRYQADLLQQMQEREARREAEKSKRKKEDEEERMRLSIEIERERLEKEEEEAKQLIKSKQLAAANVAAAESTLKPLRSRPTVRVLPENELFHSGQPGPLKSRSFGGEPGQCDEQLHKESVRASPDEAEQPAHLRNGLIEEKAVRPSIASELQFALDLDTLKAELRMQSEEMRTLQNQQRQVLQHMQYHNQFQNVLNGRQRQRWLPGPAEYSCAPEVMPTIARTSVSQRQLQRQNALIISLLRDAGVPNFEQVAKRLVESGLLNAGYDSALHRTESWERLTYDVNSETDAKTGVTPGCADEGCGDLRSCPSKQHLTRGLSKSSCCSVHCAAPEAAQPTHNEEEMKFVEDPEERPLPTLMKRQQQHVKPPVTSAQQQQSQVQKSRQFLKPSPVASATNSSCNSRCAEAHGPEGAAEQRQGRAFKGVHKFETPQASCERRWKLNELWACVTSGFPPPPSRAPAKQIDIADGASAFYAENSWCTSDCESELPCHTVPLPPATESFKPGFQISMPYRAAQRSRQRMQKSGWLPPSQMEYLDLSTTQTMTSEEQAVPGQSEQDLYMALLSKVVHGRAYEGIRVAQRKRYQPKQEDISPVEFLPEELSVFDGGMLLQNPTEMDCPPRSDLPNKVHDAPAESHDLLRALSDNAAPLRLQQLYNLEKQNRQRYASESPKARFLKRLEAASNRQQVHESQQDAVTVLRNQDRFKSRLSWEADTAYPLDEGLRKQWPITQAQVKSFGSRLSDLPPRPTPSPDTKRDNNPSSCSPDSLKPTPAKPPKKHALPTSNPARSSSLTASNTRRSKFSKVFGGMLLRTGSRTRQ
ncbi:hypothetical protein Emed_001399 [Eimeria media]